MWTRTSLHKRHIDTWGFADNLNSYSEFDDPAIGQSLVFQKDLKQILRNVVSDPLNSIPANNKNPDNWYVSSAYYGPHVWGGMLTTYEASNFRLAERWPSTEVDKGCGYGTKCQ